LVRLVGVDDDLLEFTRSRINLRQSHPVFRRRRLLVGADTQQLCWFTRPTPR
jgi:pullulanase/glycogen debranching enzyme